VHLQEKTARTVLQNTLLEIAPTTSATILADREFSAGC